MKIKLAIILVFPVMWFTAAAILSGHAEQPSFTVKSYAIKSIPFAGYETIPDAGKIPVMFYEYGSKIKVIYPTPKELAVNNTAPLIKECKEALLKNLDRIIQAETQNPAVKEYLTFENRLPPLTKENLSAIVSDPREKTFQRNAVTGKTIAEFRSKEFDMDDNMKSCIYLTFICDPDSSIVEEIIISAVKLEPNIS